MFRCFTKTIVLFAAISMLSGCSFFGCDSAKQNSYFGEEWKKISDECKQSIGANASTFNKTPDKPGKVGILLKLADETKYPTVVIGLLKRLRKAHYSFHPEEFSGSGQEAQDRYKRKWNAHFCVHRYNMFYTDLKKAVEGKQKWKTALALIQKDVQRLKKALAQTGRIEFKVLKPKHEIPAFTPANTGENKSKFSAFTPKIVGGGS